MDTTSQNIDRSFYKPMQYSPKVTLILGGGGARGFAHVGTLKALHEAHIPIDLIIGTSVGSLIGALYAFNPDPQALYNLALKTTRSMFFNLNLWRFWHGLSNGMSLYNFVKQNTHDSHFEDLKVPLIAVAVNHNTGQLTPISTGCSVAKAVQASTALPPLYRPVKVDDHILIDGGAVSPCAVEIARMCDAKLIIAAVVPPTPSFLKRIPSHAFAHFMRFESLREKRLVDLAAEKADIVIEPNLHDHGILDFNRKENLIKAGEESAKAALPKLRYQIESKLK